MRGWKVYRQNKSVIAPDTDDLKITCEKVPEGFILELTQACLADHSTANNLQEIGFDTIDGVEKTLTADDGSQNFSTHMRGSAYLVAGEAPYGKVESPTGNDVITLSVHGKLWPKE